MTDELQGMAIEFDESEPVNPDPVEQEQEPATGDEPSESAPDSGDNHDKKVEFSEDQQRKIDEIVAKQVFKRKELEREHERTRKELEELRKQLPTEQRPKVPDMPDPLSLTDEQYRRYLADRDEAIKRQAAFDAQQALIQQQMQAQQAQLIAKQQEALLESANTYKQRAGVLGVKQEELLQAGNIVAQFVSEDLGQVILQDDHGPLITKYLANNLAVLDELSRMNPILAAARIASEIKPKAAALKPKVNQAPDPLQPIRQAGRSATAEGPEGATYE